MIEAKKPYYQVYFVSYLYDFICKTKKSVIKAKEKWYFFTEEKGHVFHLDFHPPTVICLYIKKGDKP